MSKPKTTSKSTHLRVSLLLFGASVYLVLFAIAINSVVAETQSFIFYVGGYVTILIISLFGWHTLRHAYHEKHQTESIWLHPPLLMSCWLIAGIMLPGFISFFSPIEYEYHRQVIQIPTATLAGSLIIAIGFVTMWVSYLAGIKKLKPLNLPFLKSDDLPFGHTAIVFIIAIAVHLLQVSITGIEFGSDITALGGLQGFAQWLNSIRSLQLLVLAIVALKCFCGEWPKPVLVVVMAILLIFGFLSGFMKPIIHVSIIVLIALHQSKAISFRYQVLLLISFVALSIIVVPIAQGLREQFGLYDSTNLIDVFDYATVAYQNSWGKGLNVGLQIFFEKIDARQTSLAHIPAWIAHRTPDDIPFFGWRKFIGIPLFFIPRAIWSQKPILALGRWFNVVYFGASPNTETSIAFITFSEGYLYVGWLGVVVTGLLLGLLLAFLYVNTVKHKNPAILLALFPAFYDLEAQFTLMFIGVAQRYVVFCFVYWLMVRTKRERIQHNQSVLPATSSH